MSEAFSITPELVFAQFDPHYFHDYTTFTGMVRHFVARSLRDGFTQEKSPTDAHRRLLISALYKEEYAAYEDVGAFISAFLQWKSCKVQYAIEVLLNYRPGEVKLDRLLQAHSITSDEDLFQALGVISWIPEDWAKYHPDIDAVLFLKRACRFFYNDCMKNQKDTGVRAYNKIKHGGLMVPDGSKYLHHLPSCPATVFENSNKSDTLHPYILNALPMDDKAIDFRERIVEQIQFSLRALTAFYVMGRYPWFLSNEKNYSSPARWLHESDLSALRNFIKAVCDLPV